MASRSRARAFALQMLYCADIHVESCASVFHQLEQNFLEYKPLQPVELAELQFVQKLEQDGVETAQHWLQEFLDQEFSRALEGTMLSLYHAQLELPEEWYHERRLETAEEVRSYHNFLDLLIEPMEAYRLTTEPELYALFQYFCAQSQAFLQEFIDHYAPHVISHWISKEADFLELLNLGIDRQPLVEVLCMLQTGQLSALAAKELIKRIRKEYDPNNLKEKRSAVELAMLGRKNLLRPPRSIQPISREPDSLLNSDRRPAEPEEIEYATRLIQGVVESIAEIDMHISKASISWRLDRMSIIDRNILRLGCFELLHQKNVPSRVVLNEAINLTKIFSGSSTTKIAGKKRSVGYSDGVKFVNGVLDKIARDIGKKDLSKR